MTIAVDLGRKATKQTNNMFGKINQNERIKPMTFSTLDTLQVLYLVLRMSILSAAYIRVHLRLDFFMKSNTMNPDQTALKEAA